MHMLSMLVASADVAEEGRNIILSMLVVGLIFVGVIALGQLANWLLHRK